MSGFVVWFTGLSGAGKSTLAALLASALRGRSVHVEVLDGDEVRTHLSKGLTFSREDRDTNIRRIGFVAKLLARSGACAITAAISPFRDIRDEQRTKIDRFVEVYCCSSIDALAARDPKGLYRKALAGEIKGFTGIDDPYEEPLAPEVVVHTDRETKEESLAKILKTLEQLGYVASRATQAQHASSKRLVAPHGGELTVRRILPGQTEALTELAKSLPVIDLDAESEHDIEQIGSGAYSPLEGFLTSKDWHRVALEMRLENGLPWPVPVGLPVTDDVLPKLALGREAALRARDGQVVGVIDVSDIYCPADIVRTRTMNGPLGSEDPEMLRQVARARMFVGGKLRLIAGQTRLEGQSPAETRRKFEDQGTGFAAAFKSLADPDLAEEYLARVALDVTGGLWWQVNAKSMAAYASRVDKYFPAKRIVLSTANPSFAVGPRSALLEALVAQNHGCSHVVLRQTGPFDLRDLFALFAPGEIAVQPLCFETPYESAVTHSIVTERSAPDGR